MYSNTAPTSSPFSKAFNLALALLFLGGLYAASRYHYLLFHSLAELFSIVIAFAIFMFAWHSRRYTDDFYFVFLGIAYLFIGGLDTLHTFAYEGMHIFPERPHYATQLWIAARAMEALSLLAAFSFIGQKPQGGIPATFAAFGVTTILCILAIFQWDIFPVTFVPGEGLTPFKKVSEYIICFILLAAIVRLYRYRGDFDETVFRQLLWSLVFTILSELAFTFYVSMYGLSNLIGHFFKIISFKFLYEAVLATGLTRPHDLLFHDLKRSEEALREANRTKDAFFSIIAHDMKNAFHNLLAFSGVLMQYYDSFDDGKKREFIKDIHDSSAQTYGLLENLLHWSTLQTSGIKLRPERFDMALLADENLNLLRGGAEAKGIALQSSIPSGTTVHADFNMVNTALRNLLSNAIKFTPTGGQVALSSRRKGEAVEITVSDTGVGLSREEKERLFRIDVKHSTPGTAGELGTGLGLVLCREFIEKNGGSIYVESTQGVGSRFVFTLPRSGQEGEDT